MFTNKLATVIFAQALAGHPEGPSVPLEEVMCVTEAVYFEARGEPVEGRYAVGRLIQNRVESPRYPETFCKVVEQYKQFSYRNSGAPKIVIKSVAEPNADALWWSVQVSLDITNNQIPDFLNGALHYYAHNSVTPSWDSPDLLRQVIANHTYVVGVK